jgi:UDP-GlcNAc:undecaprenyl-phosphate/decaprenyl-phosphate GlcNAc-1-phosphate transferase
MRLSTNRMQKYPHRLHSPQLLKSICTLYFGRLLGADIQEFLLKFSPMIFATFSLTLLLLLALAAGAKKLGLLDHPSDRKRHQNPTPLVGGIAIFISIYFINLIFGIWDAEHQVIMASMLAVIFIGVVDDLYQLHSLKKLLAQAFAATLVVLISGLKVTYLGNLLGTGFVSLPSYTHSIFTVIALVGLINAVNMMDGIDGLAGGVSLISLIGFIALSIIIGDHNHLQSALVFSSAITAFLLLNFRFKHHRPAKVFLGDAGCMMLGLILTTLAIDLSKDMVTPVNPIITVWIVALPLMDMARLMWVRKQAGTGMMTSGRDHLHHLLLKNGYSVRQVSLMMMGLQIMFVGVAIVGVINAIPDHLMFYGFILTLIAYSFWVAHLNRATQSHVDKVFNN